MANTTDIIFDHYMEQRIQALILEGKMSSAEMYDGALKRIYQCFGKKEVPLSDVTQEWVQKLKKNLTDRNLSANSINTYLYLIRNMYHRVFAAYGIIKQSEDPFKKVFLTVRRKPREPLSIDILNKIQQAKLKEHEYLIFSRDLFLFSYYAGGMSFMDMASVKKTDIYDGELHFTRSRSRSEISVPFTKPMKIIINTYRDNSIYLLPIICSPEKDFYQQYKSGLQKYNVHIKRLAEVLNIDVPLSTPKFFQEDEATIKKSLAAAKSELIKNL
jgi:site-specific recombinase XerD